MPRVPTAERRVITGALPGGEIRADVTPVPSRAAETGIRLAADIIQEERKKANQIATLEADVELSKFETELLHDPEVGALNQLGKSALGVYEPTLEAYDKKVSEISAALSNDEQRFAFNSLVVSRRGTVDKQLQKHSSRESLRYDNETTQAWLENGLTSVSENYEDTEAVERYIGESKAVLADFAKRNGKSAEWLKREKAERTSDTHKAVIAQILADGNDIKAKEYFKAHDAEIIDDKDIKAKLGEASTEGEAARITGDVWDTLGPKKDTDPVQSDKMAKEIRKRSKDQDVIKTALTNLDQRANLHNSSAQERTNANLDAVWEAYSGGSSLTEITAMVEYQDLPGSDKKDVKGSIERAERTIAREDKEALRIEQEVRRQELAEDVASLKATDLEQELREGFINRKGYISLKRLIDPKRSPSAKAAFKRLDDSKTKKLFNPKNADDNIKQWTEFTEMLHDFIEANPEGDPAAFVEEIMQPVDVGITEKFLDIFSFGAPGTERAEEERREELRKLAEPTRRKPLDVREGRTATNPDTGEKLIFREGKWQKLTK